MNWPELEPLESGGMEAASINRRIATHLGLRKSIDSGEKVAGQFFAGREAAMCECVSRELFLRRDIIGLLKRKGMSSQGQEDAVRVLEGILAKLRTGA